MIAGQGLPQGPSQCLALVKVQGDEEARGRRPETSAGADLGRAQAIAVGLDHGGATAAALQPRWSSRR